MVDSARITYASISKQAFWNLFNLINDRSNVPDPNDSTGDRSFVYRRLPRNYAKKFPFVVVSRTKPKQGTNTADMSKRHHSFDFTITVYSKDDDSDGSSNPHGANSADIISDSIIATLDNPDNRKTLRNYLQSDLVYDIDTDEDDLSGKSVFITEFDIRFENNLVKTW